MFRATVEARAHVAAECGLNYSHSGCIKLLARLGFGYRKPKPLPRVASAQMPAAFITSYERFMRELPADEAVYFAPFRVCKHIPYQTTDVVHPEYQTKPAFCLVKVRSNPTVFSSAQLSTAGCGRVTIHGAVNLKTCDEPFVEPTTVDGVSAAQLLTKIKARNPNKRNIHVIWGNAAYHKGADVRDFLARTACLIHLIPLPSCCPHLMHLNMHFWAVIERFWAVLHQYVTHNRHDPSQEQFADAILAFMCETIPQEWTKFCAKVSDNFRVITHKNFGVLE